ncbi:MAG: fibrinogen-like YCDxxxxGGGW domain-containing protein, partial [Candidatus Gracilibacteria bacterium]|nr:fibrinogen-like YCDxxxxGGGW domain-containing protein [Candidatus Gracilibacteria bacterium]
STGIDLLTTNSGTVYKLLLSSGSLTASGNIIYQSLNAILSNITSRNCNDILLTGKSTGNGVYTINPTGTGILQVYCDMTTEGGGWTLIGKSTNDGGSLYNSGEILGYTDTNLKTSKLSDISINAILSTSIDKIIKVTSPSVTSYNNYIKIDSSTEQWNSVGRMCNMRWTDSLSSGLWTKKICTYYAGLAVVGGPSGPGVTDCGENSLITSGINYYQKTDGTCISGTSSRSVNWLYTYYTPSTIFWNSGTYTGNSLWFIR